MIYKVNIVSLNIEHTNILFLFLYNILFGLIYPFFPASQSFETIAQVSYGYVHASMHVLTQRNVKLLLA